MKIEITQKKSSIMRAFGSFLLALLFFFVFGSSALAADNGIVENFLVDKDHDFYGRDKSSALLVYESENAYFYFESDYYGSMTPREKELMIANVIKLGKEFDTVIYPETKKVFGVEWNPGIDGDDKVTVFFTRMNYGVGGYYNPNDEYKKDQVVDDRSNEREMIYLNTDFLGRQKEEGFLSHELQHMIYWNEKTRVEGVSDDIWINEGRAELAASMVEDLLGRSVTDETLSVRKRDFLLGHEDSLADWNNVNYDYATVNIFMQYIKEQVGIGIFQPLNSTLKTGVDNLDYILKRDNDTGLNDVYTDWTIANYINDTGLDARYGYFDDSLKTGFNIAPDIISDVDGNGVIELTGTLKNWSAGYFVVDADQKEPVDLYLEVDFNGDDLSTFALPVVINYKDGSRKLELMDMNGLQDGHMEAVFAKGAVSSIVFIPSSQKIDEALEGNQVKEHSYIMDVKLAPVSEKVLPDGTLIKAADDEKIYLIEDGRKRWITDSTTFVARGYDWGKVIIVDKLELGIYWDGENISGGSGAIREGSLVKGSGPEVYLIENGKRRWIQDERAFAQYGFDWSEITRVNDQEFFQFSEGAKLADNSLAPGALIKGAGEKIYLLQAGKKCWIVSPEAFLKNNFSWSSVVETSEEVISSYNDGPNID